MNEIIRAELKNTGNRGDYLGFSETVSTTNLKGLDEELADAVGEAFCEFYKTWKMDHPNANTWQQVIYPITASSYQVGDSNIGVSQGLLDNELLLELNKFPPKSD